MFARLSETTFKQGKREEFISLATNNLLPILKKQKGFVDVIGLSSDTVPNVGVALALWQTKADAEAFYNGAEFTKLMDEGKPLVADMKVQTFTVATWTSHQIAAGQSA